MNILHKTAANQNADSKGKPIISKKWLILPVCLLILFLGVIFANYHQTISAGGTHTTEVQLIQPLDIAQVQVSEKVAKGNDALANTPSIWPTSGAVTSGFGWRTSPWDGSSELHPGIDIANSLGTPVVATADGEVVRSGWGGGYGNIVQINHGNGIETIYGHNSQVLVAVGNTVKKGQIISYIGSTGMSTGPHVHYEVRVNGTAIDPIKYLVMY
ncbi:MAG: envC 2 [Firmicutes bacterium]|nr:envC 2 [Bacillota bacterium]